METLLKPKTHQGRPKVNGETQIIGFRLPQALAREVKVEATQRGISLKDLFAEIWDQYKGQRKS